ncbi:hypothetical protein ACPCTH_33655 [Streptomyces cellulosae]
MWTVEPSRGRTPGMWTLPEPMLAAAGPDARLPAGWAAEVKWDGWRALLSWEAGHLVLRSRQGTALAPSFPELRAGAVQLPDATALDGEIVVWEAGRLAFERLQGRIQRRGAGAARLAAEWPAHFVTGVRAGSWGDSECDQSHLSRPETCVRHVPP